MNRKKVILLFFLLWGSVGLAQQDPQYTMYMFNPHAVHPAYAGSRDVLSAVLLHRNQWVGLDGAPKTDVLSIHAPLFQKKMGAGLLVTSDRIGPKSSTGYLFTYAYRFRFGKGKLALGLRGGIYDYHMRWDKLNLKDMTDLLIHNPQEQKTASTFDAGFYYYTTTFYMGASYSHLDQQPYTINLGSDTSTIVARLASHSTFTIGKVFVLTNSVTFRPSLIFKGAAGAPGSADINFSFLIDNRLWMGIGARTGHGIMALTEFNISPRMRMGYAYDLSLNRLRTVSRGSHELFIGYDLQLSKTTKTLSPRYF